MTTKVPGRFNQNDAPWKQSWKTNTPMERNNLTRRNALLTEELPAKSVSTSLQSANIKALRFFRYACRMIPFILKIHQLNRRVTPVQSKIYLANWMRDNAYEKDLIKIDSAIQYGYETVYEAEMDYCNTGYLYRFLLPKTHKYRDFGVDKFYEKKADRINLQPNSGFLSDFYKGHKTHTK